MLDNMRIGEQKVCGIRMFKSFYTPNAAILIAANYDHVKKMGQKQESSAQCMNKKNVQNLSKKILKNVFVFCSM